MAGAALRDEALQGVRRHREVLFVAAVGAAVAQVAVLGDGRRGSQRHRDGGLKSARRWLWSGSQEQSVPTKTQIVLPE